MTSRRPLFPRFLPTALLAASCSLPASGPSTSGQDTTTLADLAPTAAVVSLSPKAPRTDDDLVVNVDVRSNDPEGAAVAYRYAWTVDGVLQADLMGDRVPASRTSRGQLWKVLVTPTDARHDGPAAEAFVKVGNTPPTLSLAVAPFAPTAAQDVTAVVETFDADGDAVTVDFDWSVDGNPSSVETDTVPADRLVRGQVWDVNAVPRDDEAGGETVGAFVTIGNARPAVAGVELSPALPTVVATLTATPAETSDADRDAVTLSYVWSVNGAVLATETGTTLAAPAYHKGDVVTVTVTPADGLEGGDAVSDSVAIEDAAPTVPEITLTPAQANDADDLDCAVTTPSFDADADPVSYAFAWSRSVDGAAFLPFGDAVAVSGTVSHVSAASTGVRDRFRCVVTASAGTSMATTAAVEAMVVDHSVGAPCAPESPCDAGLSCISTDLLGGSVCTKLGCVSDADCGSGNVCDSTLGVALCLRGCDPKLSGACHRGDQVCWKYNPRPNGKGVCGGNCNGFSDVAASCGGLACSADTGLCEGTATAFRACAGTTGQSCRPGSLCLTGLSGNAATGGANCLPAFCRDDADCGEVVGSTCALSIPVNGTAPDFSCADDADCTDTSLSVAPGKCQTGVCQYRWGLCAKFCDAPGTECPAGTTCQAALGYRFCVE